MNEQKRYTAQEMRHAAMDIQSHVIKGPSDIVFDSTLCRAVEMICQAADSEEKLAQLKARLEAVVKECEKINEEKFRMNEVLAAKGILNRILRAACGESETENK